MTATSRFIEFRFWFVQGYGELSIPLAVGSMAVNCLTLLLVAGIGKITSLVLVLLAAGGALSACVVLGFVYERKGIISGNNNRMNLNNPQIGRILELSEAMAELMKLRKEEENTDDTPPVADARPGILELSEAMAALMELRKE